MSGLTPASRLDVEIWLHGGVAGDLTEEEVALLADRIVTDAHMQGLRYGEDWGLVIDMSDDRFYRYVASALDRR